MEKCIYCENEAIHEEFNEPLCEEHACLGCAFASNSGDNAGLHEECKDCPVVKILADLKN